MNYNIPIAIRNVFNLAAPGTKIWHYPVPEINNAKPESDYEEFSTVKAFATIDNVALVNVEG
jgi:aspartokinase/homoserine dehydrogenase 1